MMDMVRKAHVIRWKKMAIIHVGNTRIKNMGKTIFEMATNEMRILYVGTNAHNAYGFVHA